MVRSRKKRNRKSRKNQGRNQQRRDPRKIKPSTPHAYTDEHLTPYGGLLPLVKLLDGLKFRELFEKTFHDPARKTLYGSYFFVQGLLMLLFIGFRRLHHFVYIQEDPMLLGILGIAKLPAVSTFWRFLQSLTINHATYLLRIIAVLRERAWKSLGICHSSIHVDIDTTVETVYGKIEGAKKGHNPKARGKKGLRPILAFIAETKEYMAGKLRRGETVNGKELGKFIRSLASQVPECVRKVTIRADAEFFCWEAVKACKDLGYRFVIAMKRGSPVFPEDGWYTVGKVKDIEYNGCKYQPSGWEHKTRFVAMRIRKSPKETLGQDDLFNDENYKYRIFVTDLQVKPHKVIREYDGRAGAENLVGEAKREGLAAIPSKRFHSNMAYFQIVLLAYNLWRYMKRFAEPVDHPEPILNTVHVSRLKLLFIAAKIVSHSDRVTVKYSRHLSIRGTLDTLMARLDDLRERPELWASPIAGLVPGQPSVQKISCTS